MRSVLIDARYFSKRDTGIYVYLCAVIELLLDNHMEVTLLTPIPLTEQTPLSKRCKQIVLLRSTRAKDFTWAQLQVPKFLRSHAYDYYFSPANRGVPAFYFGKTKLVLTVHDLIPLHFFAFYFKKLPVETLVDALSTAISIYKAKRIMAVSRATAKDIQRLFGKRATATLIPIRYMGFAATTQSVKNRKKQFVYNGGRDPRKNVPVLLEGFAQFSPTHPGYKLVLMGGGYDAYDEDLKRLDIVSAVVKTGYVSQEEKMRILAESSAIVYPSLMEGYGLPIVEALSVNTPIVCGTGGSQREVAGQAGIFLEPPITAQSIATELTKLANGDIPADYPTRIRTQLAYLLSREHEQNILAQFSES